MLDIVYYQGRNSEETLLQDFVLLQKEKKEIKISVEVFQEEEECIRRLWERPADLLFAAVEPEAEAGRGVAGWMFQKGRNRSMVLFARGREEVERCLNYYPFQVVLLPAGRDTLESVITEYLRENRKGFVDLRITTKQGVHFLDTREVCYLESWGHQITACCTKDRCCQFRGTLKKYEMLLEKCGFVRVHMSFLVNLRYCRSIEKEAVILKDGRSIPLSRDRKEWVRQALEEYHQDSF
ncbi:MAG: LytR/AlgR family response regulator transcription factor [Blautia sp.]|jgi:DNA-binding LytR/AlgR family response regulator